MWKWLILIAAGYMLFRMFSNDKRHKAATSQQQAEKVAATGEMVKDPICGTFVPMDSDIRVREGETVHRFCSFECRDKFLKQIGASKPTE